MALNADDARRRAVEAVDELAGELVELTRAMVRIPTETHPPGGDEGPGQEHLRQYFERDLGWSTDVFLPTDVEGIERHAGWWPGLDYTDRPNVVAVRPGAGGGRSLILNGHIDVVPAGPREAWSVDPYGGDLIDGRVYGRGSVDMKGGIASMIFAVRALEHAGIRLAGDVILESVVNEELGGYNGTLACILRGYEADAAIVTEGTECQVCPAHKGGQGLRVRVPGKSAHANMWWRGVSALDKAIILKQALAEHELARAEHTRDNPYFSDPELFPTPALVDTIWALSAGDPNVMSPPEEAVLDFWVDALPGEQLDEVIAGVEQRLQQAAQADAFMREHPPVLERQAIMRPFHPTAVALDHPIVAALSDGYRGVVGEQPGVYGMSGVCDAMMFNLHSKTPAVIFGPGDVALAHSPDEYVEVSELVRASKVMAHAIVDWCGLA
jgi:acetylornithine deacetylase